MLTTSRILSQCILRHHVASVPTLHLRTCTYIHCTSSNYSSSPSNSSVPKVHKVRPLTKDDVDFSFSRSSGAGGQNVNKVSTKVDMRLDLSKATWLPEEIRQEIRTAEKNKVTNEGFLVVSSQKHRTQAQNMEDALEKIQVMIDNAVEALTPKIADATTVARVKANIKAGQERRIQDKKRESMRKKERGGGKGREWD
ncbi:hypothetical protein CEUSTIGMA_g12607.t1 [Chlamydomonas eustigma]|uniref:Prokaryotic-type class I peptide chain release factors domain-containing protein n=1 Tax=Chlamydomonas eustigma TaxID=1157962 RepID=A0A250XQF9_9CHLO|nr:hypothetical protein CEUSTIGMA_g12607.t1 [Chlamydomonas eustigma]|eukprot:GAX85189.1 hypothetical protein CEUSTIGMA_g12607.t1 [Chlamydomonas eustigma]